MKRTYYNITYKGNKFKAVQNAQRLCFGCSFYEDSELTVACAAHNKNKKHACTSDQRPDGSHIIWVKVEEK